MEEENTVVICGPLSSGVVKGSKVYKCAKCGVDVTSSPVGQKLINKGAKPLCAKCGLEAVNVDDKPEFADPTEAINLAIEHLKSTKNN